MSGALARARADLEAGRPWMARDRLVGALAQRQDDELLDLLAEVHETMGDLPAAGALWFVTGRDDDRARAAVDAWRDRHASDEQRWRSIPGPVRRHARPPTALDELRAAAVVESRGRTAPLPDVPEEGSWRDALAPVGCLLVLLGVLVLVVVGGWTVWHWIRG